MGLIAAQQLKYMSVFFKHSRLISLLFLCITLLFDGHIFFLSALESYRTWYMYLLGEHSAGKIIRKRLKHTNVFLYWSFHFLYCLICRFPVMKYESFYSQMMAAILLCFRCNKYPKWCSMWNILICHWIYRSIHIENLSIFFESQLILSSLYIMTGRSKPG